MTLLLIISFIIPIILSISITPFVIRFAKSIGATDKPDPRKIHTTIIPRIGGVSIFLSVSISLSLVAWLYPSFLELFQSHFTQTLVLAGCFLGVFFLGFWDDIKPLKPGLKFGIQFIIAGIIYFAGFKISNITNPLGGGLLNVELIDFPLTLLWIVGITNAFNLIDGLDGLASGIATIASFSIFIVSTLSSDFTIAIVALVMAGALLGFLKYNFNPASIFLGDSGSLIIGFSLALLSIQSTTKISTGFALLFPLLVLVLPITDTLVSMGRRLMGSMLPNKTDMNHTSIVHKIHGMFIPDRAHIHHRLLGLGLSHRNAVLVLYSISAFFAVGAFVITQIESYREATTLVIVFGLALIFCIKKLRYHEISIFNNGLVMSVYEKWISSKKIYIGMFDVFFIAIANAGSLLLLSNLQDSSHYLNFNTLQTLIIIAFAQLLIFWFSGLYRENIKQMGIGSVINIITVVSYSVFVSALIFYFRTDITFQYILSFMIFNFYFLLTLTLGFRATYQTLNFWFNKEKQSGKNVLIYGANDTGIITLFQINHTSDNDYKVLGFLDDDPELENNSLYGYPIFGGYWKLLKIIRRYNIDSIFISEASIKPENYHRLSNIAFKYGIKIKKVRISLDEIDRKVGMEPVIAPPPLI